MTLPKMSHYSFQMQYFGKFLQERHLQMLHITRIPPNGNETIVIVRHKKRVVCTTFQHNKDVRTTVAPKQTQISSRITQSRVFKFVKTHQTSQENIDKFCFCNFYIRSCIEIHENGMVSSNNFFEITGRSGFIPGRLISDNIN